jgi:ABC-type Mn2+/Zn2+ transport system ATPase subunit
MNVPLLRLEGVALGWGRRRLLDGIDLEVARGETVGIVGPNGSGKTTLLKAVLGIHAPRAGAVRWGGAAGRPRIGYVPQRDQIDPLFPFTAFDVVLLPLAARHLLRARASEAERRAAREALDRVGLADRAGARYASLSGGQRQRVLVARALAVGPELLVLDEPTSGLDLGSAGRILDLVDALRRERSLTVLLVSHDLTLVAQRADRVLLLHERTWAFGPTAAIVEAGRIRGLYGDGVRVLESEGRRVVLVTPREGG